MDPAVRANAYAISYRLLGRSAPAAAVADAAAREVDRTGGVGDPEWLGFLAADTVARSLALVDEAGAEAAGRVVDDGPRASERDALRRRLRDASGEQRAAAALVHLAGYPVDVVAGHLELPADRVAELAAVIAPPPGSSHRDLGDPGLRRRPRAADAGPTSTPPAPPAAVPVGVADPTAPTAPSPAAARGRHRGLLLSVVGAVVVVAVLALLASRAVGPRPTLGPRTAGAAGAAVGPDVPPLPSAGCTSPSAAGQPSGASLRGVTTPDGDRPYRIWDPDPTGEPAARPLVVAVPGFGQSSGDFAEVAGLEPTVGASSVVATLEPTSPELEVNVAQDTTRADDVLYALAVYDDVVSARCVDLRRTSVVGYGPGGQLAGVLGCARPEYFAAVVAVHGAFLPQPCVLDPPVSFLGVWTADDAVLPLGGGEGVGLPGLAPGDPAPARIPAPDGESVLQGWAELVGAEASGTTTDADGTVTREWGAPGGAVVEGTVRPTGGHAWPAGIDADIGRFLTRTARSTGSP